MYDCTNVVDGYISIITNIGLDHMDILGNTVEEITDQKAGIIKKNKDTIALFQEKITDILAEKCKKENNKLHIIHENEIIDYSFDEEYQNFSYKNYKNMKTNLKGKCQIYNSAIAIECIEVLKSKGFQIPNDAIKNGLKTVVHKARFEVLKKKPKIIFDGGHNENAINNLCNTINQYYPEKKKVYILSILKTKDYKTVIKILAKDTNGIFFFTTGNDANRYVSKEDLYTEARKYMSKDIYKEELQDAIKIAKEKYREDVIMIIRKLLCV